MRRRIDAGVVVVLVLIVLGYHLANVLDAIGLGVLFGFSR